ncbi:MAG: S4 domain-containing protein, partial [Lachnospiraceae bacterium]|nr:S4 domain-containing protein [Lachnospiraceae bacterium]
MRLDKFLADMNMDSRSNLKKAIRKGNVTVNGSQVK